MPVPLLIELPDNLAAELATRASTQPGGLIAATLHALVGGMSLPPASERALIVHGKSLTALEAKLGKGHLLTQEDLVEKVDRLAKLEFGSYEIVLTPAQREEMVWRAKKQGKTIGQMIEATWQRMQSQFFSLIP